jgi:hypothetical protein
MACRSYYDLQVLFETLSMYFTTYSGRTKYSTVEISYLIIFSAYFNYTSVFHKENATDSKYGIVLCCTHINLFIAH